MQQNSRFDSRQKSDTVLPGFLLDNIRKPYMTFFFARMNGCAEVIE